MPVRRPKDLTQALKQGTIEPIYFLFGPETYLRDRAARAIADEAMRGTLLREFIVLLDPDNSGISRGRVRGEQPTSQWRHYHAVP